MSGCVGVSQRALFDSEQYTVIRAGTGDSYASLADQFYGHPSFASVLERYNPQSSIQPGDNVLIPRHNPNPAAVFTDGYQRIPVLCYHQFTSVHDERSSMVVSAQDFREQMQYLVSNGYHVVPLSSLRGFIEGNSIMPDKTVAITVDDGFKSFYSVAYPILQAFQLPATVFVYPDFVGGGEGLTWAQVRKLEADPLIDIQSHSKSHTSLSPLPEGETEAEYAARIKTEVVHANRILERKLGKQLTQFAYPYGDSSQQVVALLQKNEFELAVTVKKGGNPAFAYPYLLRRSMVYGHSSFQAFRRHLDVYKAMDLK